MDHRGNASASDRAVLIRRGSGGTAAVLSTDPDGAAELAWIGPDSVGIDADSVLALVGRQEPLLLSQQFESRALALLAGQVHTWMGSPALAGQRLTAAGPGRDWSPDFTITDVVAAADRIAIDQADSVAELSVRTEIEAVAGGPIRIRHRLRNDGADPFLLDTLDVVVPVPERVAEVLDFTGQWASERSPQRHRITDGIWRRESRGGRPGFDSATVLIAGTDGFGFAAGEVWGIHVGWSGNSHYSLQRQPSGLVTLGGGELLLPGEIALAAGEEYETPWVYVVAGADGLDGLAAQFHRFERSLPAHPNSPRPVNLNVWEAVYFDHDLDKLKQLADLAAEIGVERYVLDDGWFPARNDDHAGLGDWVVDTESWPDGLGPLVSYVRELGMQFGLWFEPEMVNPDSDLYRAHPDWVLATGGRTPKPSRYQYVLDLGRPEVRSYLVEHISAVLAEYSVDYVKWDHNRPLIDAGSSPRGGAPGVHEQTLGFFAVLDELRARHPQVEWESCASGGARIDLGVLERTQRVWTSDQNDALVRQTIQRWTSQLVAPEYQGAHVSSPISHQTHRALPLSFRIATALFGHFGIEWDLTTADDAARAELAAWIDVYRAHRGLLHGGRMVRVDVNDPRIYAYGVVADDQSEAIFCYAQLDVLNHDPMPFRLPGLAPERRYQVRRLGPALSGADELARWTGAGVRATGTALGQIGLTAPPREPLSAIVVHVTATD